MGILLTKLQGEFCRIAANFKLNAFARAALTIISTLFPMLKPSIARPKAKADFQRGSQENGGFDATEPGPPGHRRGTGQAR
jgi:hypothetical protein